MDAVIDSYAQMSVKLSWDDIGKLDAAGYLEGSVWRTDDKTFPLRIYVKDQWRADAMPSGRQSFDEIDAYEIDVFPAVIEALKEHGKTSAGFPTISLRFVYLDREDA